MYSRLFLPYAKLRLWVSPVILLMVFAFTLGIRIYWLSQKDGFHVDEGLSITLACYNDYMWSRNYEFNREYTGKEVKEISLCDNDRLRNVLGDIARLWKDNRDSPHTNLYYSFLRLSLAGLKTGDMQKIIFRAGFLNLIFFSISFFFFYLLLNLLFSQNRALRLAALFCTFMSTGTISNTLFFRPYQIQETAFITFAYFFVKSLDWKKYVIYDNNLYVNQKLIVLLSVITAVTLLTGYYAIIFIGFFGLYVLYLQRRGGTRNLNEVLVYVSVLIFGMILAQTLYSRYITGFGGYRAREALGMTLSGDFTRNVKWAFLGIINLLKTYYCIYPGAAVTMISFLYLKFTQKKIMIKDHAAFIFVASILYMIVVMYLVPMKNLRYVMPVFPFFILLPVMLIHSINDNGRKLSFGMMFLLSSCFLIFSFDARNIENINKGMPDGYLFAKHKEIPVFVTNKTFWKYANIVLYFNDEQKYYFIENTDNFEDNVDVRYNVCYLVTEDSPEIQDIELKDFEIESEFSISYFIGRKLIRKTGSR
jgi:hypothetical protein